MQLSYDVSFPDSIFLPLISFLPLHREKRTLEEAVKGNPALSRCASSPQERATFFDAFVSQPFQKVYQRFFAISDLSYGVANGGRLRKLLGRLKSGKKEKKS